MLTNFNYFRPLKLKTRLLYLILFVVSHFMVHSQNGVTGNPNWFIKPAVNQGFILEHRSTLGHLVKGYPTIYEFDFGKPTLGNKLWHIENNKPEVGLSFSVIDFKNPVQLGYSYAVVPYADIPLNSKERISRVVMRLSWGIAYLDKSFDVNQNHKNIAIGSKLNSFVQFKWYWQIPLTKNVKFEPGFTFTHASNARGQVPNLGLNVVSVNAALNLLIPSSKQPEISLIDSSTRAKSKNEILAYSAFGFNQREVGMSKLYAWMTSVVYQRNVRNTHKFGVGADVFVDQNYLIDYKENFDKSAKGIDNTRIALKVSYSYNLGRVSFPFEAGYYVYQKVKPDGIIISRIGVRYYDPSGIVASIGLRTHYAVAYDFEYGLGYRFYIK